MKLSALALAVVLAIAGAAAASAAPHTTPSTPGTYADYSMMFTAGNTTPGGTAGQLWSPSSAVSQWTWTPQTDGVSSNILWSTPATWPAGNIEHFTTSGPWVELSGWSGTTNGSTSDGLDYTQTVISQTLGTGDCSQMLPVPVHNGHELYAMWTVPSFSYCTDAIGTITSPSAPGVTIHFEHWQRWSVVTCSNAYFTGDTCLQQDEKWWDDNGHTYSEQLDRTGYLAKGKGWYASTNRIVGGVPNTTSISGRYFWLW